MTDLSQSNIPAGAHKLGPGAYDHDGELHIDLEEFVIASGGDPDNPADRARALEVIKRVAGAEGIPVDER